MLLKIFHNDKIKFKNSEAADPLNKDSINIRRSVDINKLLNRIKIKEKKEKKFLIISTGLIVLFIGLAWSFIFF